MMAVHELGHVIGALATGGTVTRVVLNPLTISPMWALWGFGAVTVLLGLFLWHGLGSLGRFINDSAIIKPGMAILTFLVLAVLLALEFAVSPT